MGNSLGKYWKNLPELKFESEIHGSIENFPRLRGNNHLGGTQPYSVAMENDRWVYRQWFLGSSHRHPSTTNTYMYVCMYIYICIYIYMCIHMHPIS